MEEQEGSKEKYADWKAPSGEVKMPRGPLKGLPQSQSLDQLGEKISDAEVLDQTYAAKHWESIQNQGNQKFVEGKRSAMQEIIEGAAEEGKIGMFVNQQGFDEKDKAKMSAYRQLAKRMGYEIGEWVLNKSAGTATAEIKKAE